MNSTTIPRGLMSLLEREDFALPLSYPEGGGGIESLLRSKYLEFQAAIAALSETDGATLAVKRNLKSIQELQTTILSALRQFLAGAPDLAHQRLYAGLDTLNSALPHILYGSSGPFQGTGTRPIRFFRIRDDSTVREFQRGDLFHIPLDKRDRVGLQRFSIAGLPCLYASSSIFTCWHELGMPPLSSVWVSRLERGSDRPLKVLMIRRPHRLIPTISRQPDEPALKLLVEMTLLWSLYAACLVRRPPEHVTSFVVEYAIPQMLLAWIVRPRVAPEGIEPEDPRWAIDGVCYPSTRVPHDCELELGLSFAFPVRASPMPETGWCPELSRDFRLTNPVNWQVALASGRHDLSQVNHHAAIGIAGLPIDYKLTDFARVESLLDQAPCESVV